MRSSLRDTLISFLVSDAFFQGPAVTSALPEVGQSRSVGPVHLWPAAPGPHLVVQVTPLAKQNSALGKNYLWPLSTALWRTIGKVSIDNVDGTEPVSYRVKRVRL